MLKKISELISTFFYIGKLPIAPGTFGSLPAFPICYMIVYFIENNKDLFMHITSDPLKSLVISAFLACLLSTLIVFIIGMIFTRYYIADRPEEDPKEVVIDEVAGQVLTITLTAISVIFAFLSSMPEYYSEFSIRIFFSFIMPFALFRFFDVFKPWPICWLGKNVKGAFGIMIDDIVAALFATILHFAIFFFILEFYPNKDALDDNMKFEQELEKKIESPQNETLEGNNVNDYVEDRRFGDNFLSDNNRDESKLVMDLDKRIYKLTKQLKQNARASASKYMFATAESCTGGMVASAITAMPGSSQYFDRGFVTYSNDAKKDMLGVLAETLNTGGAVSKNSAKQMALGATRNSHANIAVSITGIAGPSGGSKDKPVGTVFIAISLPNSYKDISKEAFQNSQELVSDYLIVDTDSAMKTYVANFLFTGDRGQIRKKSCIAALELMLATF